MYIQYFIYYKIIYQELVKKKLNLRPNKKFPVSHRTFCKCKCGMRFLFLFLFAAVLEAQQTNDFSSAHGTD